MCLGIERIVQLFLQSCITVEFRLSPGGGVMTDDSGAYGTEDEPVDVNRDDISDPTKEEVAIGNPVVNDEPKELDEEVTDDPEYEPLEPDEPE